jgi:hypothetical protein
MMLHLYRHQHVGVLVAGSNPIRGRLRANGQAQQRNRKPHNNFKIQRSIQFSTPK